MCELLVLEFGGMYLSKAIRWLVTRRQDTAVAFNYFGANHRLDEEAIILGSVKFNVSLFDPKKLVGGFNPFE